VAIQCGACGASRARDLGPRAVRLLDRWLRRAGSFALPGLAVAIAGSAVWLSFAPQ
jgi:hypothetical protein